MSEAINTQTGELVPMMDGTPMPVQLDKMRQMLEYVEKFVGSVLKDNEDYAKLPGTPKPTLLQPGAEKICFAFALSPDFETITRVEDSDREWSYPSWDKYTKQAVEKTARGYFRYEVKCRLIHRETGRCWSSGIGVCESSERGREVSPANTIIKMAQKRAFVAAAKSAAFLSGRFTQDIEDYKGEQAVHANTPANDEGYERSMLSKYENGKCNFCGDNHVQKGEQIVLFEKKWGHIDCFRKLHRAEDTEATAEEPPDDSGDPIRNDLIKEILDLEIKVKKNGKTVPELRAEHAGNRDLGKAGDDNLVAYHSWLNEQEVA